MHNSLTLPALKSSVSFLPREIYQFSQSPPKSKDIQSNLRCFEQQKVKVVFFDSK